MTDRNYLFALPAGTDISGYVIESVLGSGGFGITYRARNPVTGVTVAIKEFFPQGLATREGAAVHLHADVSEGSYEAALRKFEQEAAKLTGRYRHPNIVRGVNFLKMNNTAYFVMEFIAGISLDVYLNSKNPPADETELRHIFEPIFDAVDYIHNLNGMHRDLTPRNIMIRPDGTAMLVDFGAAGEGLDTERPYSTAFAQPNYAPPEQLAYDDGRMQGRHTDIFSLAGVLYRAVAGQPPVRPLKRAQEVSIHGAEADPYVPLAEAALAPGLYHPAFFDAIDQALRLDYRQRPATLGDFRQLLGWDAPTAVYHPSDLYQHEDAPTVRMVPDEVVAHALERDPLPAASRPSLLTRLTVGAALVLGLTVVGAAAWLTLEPKDPAPKPAPVQQAQVQQAQKPPVAAPEIKTVETAPVPPPQPAPPVVQAPPPPPAPPVKPVAPPDPAWPELAGHVPVGTVVQLVAGLEPPKPDLCRQACKDDRSCVAYAVVKQACSLFTSVTGLVPDANGRTGTKPGGAAVAVVKGTMDRAEARKTAFRRIEGIALNPGPGGALTVPKGIDSDTACAFVCTSNAACKGYDFQSDTRTCRLLREVRPDIVTNATGHIAAVEDTDGTLSDSLKKAGAPKPRQMVSFSSVDFGGEVLGRDPAASSDGCLKACLADQSCIASMYSEQICTRFAQIGDIEPRPGSDVHVDSRQGALILRLQALSVQPAPVQPGPIGPVTLGQQDPLAAPDGHGPSPLGQPQTNLPGLTIPGAPDEAEPFDGYELAGQPMASDLARTARFTEACEAACQDSNGCIGFTFGEHDHRCRLFSGVTDLAPNASMSSGILRNAGFQSIETVRRKLAMKEANRANFRALPGGCAPTGQASQINQPTAEACGFACEGSGNCQAWVFSPRDRTCHILTTITGAVGGLDTVSSVLDPSGRRVKDLARVCGPIPPAAIGGPVPPAPIGGEAPRDNKPFFKFPF